MWHVEQRRDFAYFSPDPLLDYDLWFPVKQACFFTLILLVQILFSVISHFLGYLNTELLPVILGFFAV